jgi:hypothetical protein
MQGPEEPDRDYATRIRREFDSGVRVEVFKQTSAQYGPQMFPSCPNGHGTMARQFNDGGRIAYRSKGVFPCELPDLECERLGDRGPVRVEDYQDYKKKLKERGLMEREPSRNTQFAMREIQRKRKYI